MLCLDRGSIRAEAILDLAKRLMVRRLERCDVICAQRDALDRVLGLIRDPVVCEEVSDPCDSD
jgi:hypothetical protein